MQNIGTLPPCSICGHIDMPPTGRRPAGHSSYHGRSAGRHVTDDNGELLRQQHERCADRAAAGPHDRDKVPEMVAVLQEHIHDLRSIAIDGRPHLPEAIRQFVGSSHGHRDADTLVAETINPR